MYQSTPARRCRIHGKPLVLLRRWGFSTGFETAHLAYGDYYCPARNCGTRKTFKLRP
jgi:hypothetical protein